MAKLMEVKILHFFTVVYFVLKDTSRINNKFVDTFICIQSLIMMFILELLFSPLIWHYNFGPGFKNIFLLLSTNNNPTLSTFIIHAFSKDHFYNFHKSL